MSKYDPSLTVPPEVMQAVQTIREFATKHGTGDNWQVAGLGPVFPLQRQLDDALGTGEQLLAATEAIKRQVEALKLERDQLRAALRLADALRNQERGMDKPERRKWRRE